MKTIWGFFMLCCAMLIHSGCTDSDLPVLTTSAVTGITSTTAECGGNITSDGGAAVKSRGICWSTSPNPDLGTMHNEEGDGTGMFTSSLTGLVSGASYYVRAYATNKAGTAYGNEVVFATDLADPDGNVYHTVVIGDQVWMGKNLRTTKYFNGTPIDFPNGDDNAWYGNAYGAYAWYDNDENYKQTYGALYNWNAVNNPAGLCPVGWHVPSDAEWTTLIDYLGGETVAGSPLKEVGNAHWMNNNGDATDETGFKALPGGSRSEMGTYANLGYSGYWWSSTKFNMGNAWCRIMTSNNGYVTRLYSHSGFGYSVRCLKDAPTP